MKRCLNFLIGTIFLVRRYTEGADILFFIPFPPVSHHRIVAPLINALAQRGHNITFATPFPRADVLLPSVNIIQLNNMIPLLEESFNAESLSSVTGFKAMYTLIAMIDFLEAKVYSQEAFKSLLASHSKFDAVVQSSTMMEASVALDHRFNAIGIELLNVGGSHWTNHILSNPSNPSYILDFKSPYTDRMSFAERLHNTFIYLTNVLVYGQVILAMAQTRADKFFRYPGWEERPPIESLLANKSLVLMNTHPSMGYAVPTSPHFIQVGGISIVPNKPLPEDLKTYLDSATDGFVYFSLGSNIAVSNLLRGERLRSFTRALGSLKQKVVWKWEKDDFHEKPGNTITAPWFPQQDILGHKNCRLFITQGGIVSLTEALNYAVPVVGIPVFIDQRRNMMYVKSQGYGVTVELTNITEQSITWAVNEVLNNPTKMAEEKSAIFKDRPMSSLDTAVYWVEYAIRHKGAPHLKPALNLLPWYKSMLLDVAAVIFVALLTFGAAIYFLSKKLIHFAVKMALPKIPPRGQNLRQKLY